jgi:hypothetical protein
MLTSIHWQNVRVDLALGSLFLTRITLINNRKFNCLKEAYQCYWGFFSVNMGKKSFIQEQCPPPTPSPMNWTKHFNSNTSKERIYASSKWKVGFYHWVWYSRRGGGGHQYLGFSKRVSRCVLFYPILKKNIQEVPILWIRHWALA